MVVKQIKKSELLKHIPIQVVNQYENSSPIIDHEPIRVKEVNGNYYVEDNPSLHRLLQMNGTGDLVVDCVIKESNEL